MRRSHFAPAFSFLAFCLAAEFSSQPFAQADPLPVNVSFPAQTVLSTNQPYGSSIVVADFDGDGLPDVAVASMLDNQISWYRNQGDGTFSPAILISTAAIGPSSLVAADIDADGRIDLVSASTLDNKIAWYRNIGGAPGALFNYNPANPTANQRIISTSAEYAYSVTVADVNGDGLWDVVSASWTDNKVAYYLNLGGGNFGWSAARPTANQHVISTEGQAPTCVAAADLDGDGITDLAVTSSDDDTLAWFKGGYDSNGNPTFTRYVISTNLPRAFNVAIADLNKDHSPDLIVASPYGSKISVFQNISQQPGAEAPFFGPEQVVSNDAFGVTSVIAADINRDGNLDIVAALLLDDQILWIPSNGVDSNGNVSFGAEQVVTNATQGPASVVAADFDGNGVMDIGSTSQVDKTVSVFLNAGQATDFTQQPTLISPESGTFTTAPITISYTLPEDALPGSVTVTFVSGATERDLILASDGESAGTHTFSFDPADPGSSSSVQSAPSSISDGTYTVTVSYQDSNGDPAATSLPATGVIIDAEAPYRPGATTKILAVKGGVVPGAGVTGSNIPADARLRVLGVPSINAASHLGITASYSTGNTLRQAVLGPGADGNTAVLVGAGDSVPDASGTRQSQLAFVNFADVLLSDSDSVAFIASLRGIGAAASSVNVRNDHGIWTNAGDGTFRLVAREGDVAPGLSVKFDSFTSVALSPSFTRGDDTVQHSDIAYVAQLVGTGVTAANNQGLWIYETSSAGSPSTKLLFRTGQTLSLRGGPAKRIKTLAALPPVDGAAGQGNGSVPAGVAVRVEFSDLTEAIVRVSGDGVIHDLVNSADVPSNSTVKVVRFGVPMQNANGDTLTVASLNTSTNNSGLVLATDQDGTSMAVREGDVADGTNGATFTDFKVGVVNDNDDFAFVGTIAGPGVTASTNTGVWYLGQSVSDPGTGAPVLIAREGYQAAGAPDGARFGAFRSIALPDGANGPVFLADLLVPAPGAPNPANVTATNNTGVWAVDSNGVLRLIVREGDVFPGTTLTIRALAILGNVLGSPAQTRSYNGHAEIVYRATLSDGSDAIAKARIP